MTKRLMVVAGGTGGHIFPGIAVANELKSQGWEVSWVGTADRMEAQVVPKHGFEIDFINVQGVRGNGIKRLLKAPFMVLKAILAARSVIKYRRPNVVLAMGGYVTGPVGVAAKLTGIPLVIHEQNAVAGLSNKLLANIANKVLAAFPSAFASNEVQVVGNPVRHSVATLTPKKVAKQLNCLVVGGSLGAKVLNDILPAAFAKLSQTASLPIAIRHQSGKGHKAELIDCYKSAGVAASVFEFIDDMDSAYDWADIVICRAGALTVSEIAAAGKMALFVPYPHAVDDHQTANAGYLVNNDAALLLPQSQFNEQTLCELLFPYVHQPEMIEQLAIRAKQQAKLDATSCVAKVCEQLSSPI
ncbi:UDP-N-acetylglucosamine--N-acetylmuramyl-(pentapeptide) pyrophosphoryl-undecaprenol N-acetylglucosamine transferase [Pseudoalteromonas holothuriae]|uniref:UDP-N-acetylglucosamine--N-acetylmuramyl-(pentapeptide) pyrophosphoryl-undecaprenol N-acetylglucosamine transferase n=1 Tax=Pseudoalteromonas holothuriae TaxID=2963714 RepID=A0A9W4W1Y9_9GAMM|nr:MULTISPECIES: undecaprenyldiphospho-muramoylpentapeptide beta-N-acetylglucosaminyltransferase [unclassified Pseudoalteromonas]CAH9063534.1 UDP-N-acetylglucosamine--N-acetylmuramyl-(pentapeptide) pyrophosphoryl-undecaprenol N-acetylglucosamine transferase [Pseudoalteromonas sp. CIP111854]CAH9064835.1 UDP-N-acetylglucosamine--N-acetylmuramyl-(pentapeptide) pyrophosphoryl-undecaprenol N-acetylglucosamine transferase [Pseudoalteromonas sp. CIP111951]